MDPNHSQSRLKIYNFGIGFTGLLKLNKKFKWLNFIGSLIKVIYVEFCPNIQNLIRKTGDVCTSHYFIKLLMM